MKPTNDAVSKPGSHTKGEIPQISRPLPDAAKKGANTIKGS